MKKLLVFAGLMSCAMFAFSAQVQAQEPHAPCAKAKAMEKFYKSRNVIMSEEEAKELRDLKTACRLSKIVPK